MRRSRSTAVFRETDGATSIPTDEEIFFEGVAETELQSCFLYEYARADPAITECVIRWRRQFPDLEKAARAALVVARRGDLGNAFIDALWQLTPLIGEPWFLETAAFLLSRASFPGVPWQRLNDIDKKKWENSLGLYKAFKQRKGGLRPIELFRSNLEEFYRAQFGPIPKGAAFTYTAFECDWRGGVEAVIRDFQKWARKQWRKLAHKKTPRDLQREWLKQLGVMRLHAALHNWGKVKHYMRQKGVGLGDANQKGDTSACRRAGLAARKRKVFPIR